MSGWDAFIEMRTLNPSLKSVFATGYMDEDQKGEMLQFGVHAIIQKPYVPMEIVKAVRQAINSIR
jgi:DNA-binding NarL/FixJ family response regulator